MYPVKSTLFLCLAVLLPCVVAGDWNCAHHWCPRYSGRVFSKAVRNPHDLDQTVEGFRKTLGGQDNGNSSGLSHGHRSINWDANIVPFKMPGDFFKNTVTRGAEFFLQLRATLL